MIPRVSSREASFNETVNPENRPPNRLSVKSGKDTPALGGSWVRSVVGSFTESQVAREGKKTTKKESSEDGLIAFALVTKRTREEEGQRTSGLKSFVLNGTLVNIVLD